MKKETARLREARIKAGLTIQELADAAGLTWSNVQAIETGRLPGTLATKTKLADTLRMSFKELWPDTYREMTELMVTKNWRGKK